jgi:hypothetical protein
VLRPQIDAMLSFNRFELHPVLERKSNKPADFPEQQSTKVLLVTNMNAANAVRLVVPTPLPGSADGVIE